MNIKYITNVRIPTPRAQGYAIMKMCSEFAMAGARVELFVPSRKSNFKEEDPFNFYQLPKDFVIRKIPSLDLLDKTFKFGRLLYWLDLLFFLIMAKMIVKPKKGEIIYTRDFITALAFSKDYFLCLELHDIPTSRFLFKWLIKRPKLFFVLNANLKRELIKLGIDQDNIQIKPSGVELKDFDLSQTKLEARESLDLPIDQRIVLYSGQFYSWKGVETLAQAAYLLPEVTFLFVGGIEPEYSQFVKKYGEQNNIIIRPFQDRKIIPLYMKAADVLAITQSAKEKISSHYSSPLKMFEYMAAKRPIVAPDLPSIRETLNETNSVLVQPDDPSAFAQATEKILADETFANKISNQAYQEVQKYAWSERAQSILEEIEKRCTSIVI